MLSSTPLLAYPKRHGTFFVSCDASNDGLGAVLEQDQIDENGVCTRRVIAYASKTLTRGQRNYCATNKELLAVVWACENFRYYLIGRHFTVITDHASLTWLKNFKNPEGMVARWLQRLSPFDIIKYSTGQAVFTIMQTASVDAEQELARDSHAQNVGH